MSFENTQSLSNKNLKQENYSEFSENLASYQENKQRISVKESKDLFSNSSLNQNIFENLNNTSENASTSEIIPQSNGASRLVNTNKFRADSRFSGINGQGFSVVVIDTGIDRNHPFFGADKDKNGVADRIVYQYDFADNDRNASDRTGHGSHISSIIASSNSNYPGIAPGANIINLKVFQDDGDGSFKYVEEALQWVNANAKKYNIASVNMSFGDGGNHNKTGQKYGLGDEIAALTNKKVAVVAASGNNFAKYNGAQGVAYPAADPNAISVGAVYDTNLGSESYGSGATANSTGADLIAPFSQRHNNLTSVFAPGAPITAANQSGGTMTLQGTSQAAAHVTGVVALAQQLAVRELGRRLSIPELEKLLASTGKKIVDGDNEKDNVKNTELTFERVDMLALGKAILNKKNNLSSSSEVVVPSTDAIGEFGTVTQADSNTQTIRLDRNYENPVVFISPLSSNGSDPANVRITDLEGDLFSATIQEPNYADGTHGAESFSYLVLEAGSWQLEDGTVLQVGTTDTNTVSDRGWETVNFENSFSNTPVILTQVQTDNGSDFVYTRQRNATNAGFEMAMQEEEAQMKTGHATETLGWMAISSGSGSWSGNNYQAGTSGDRVTDAWSTLNFSEAFDQTPQLLASIGTFDGADSAGLRYQNLSRNGVELKVEEETSLDVETSHTSEDVNFFALAGSGLLSAQAYDPLTNTNTTGIASATANLESNGITDDYDLQALGFNYPLTPANATFPSNTDENISIVDV
jgi:serine protease AprX